MSVGLVVFPHRKPIFFGRFFGCPQKTKPKKQLVCFQSAFFVLQPTATKNRPKPAGVFGEKPKNRPSHFQFRFIFGSQPPSPHDKHMHAESFEMLILLVEPRNLPIRVRFRFRFRFFFCFETTKMTETDRHFGEQTKKRPRPFSFPVHNADP